MSDPVNIPLPEGVWTLVAENLTNGVLKIMNTSPNLYLETYRSTGNTAPINDDGANPIDSTRQVIIKSSRAIDVYVKPLGAPGIIRLDA